MALFFFINEFLALGPALLIGALDRTFWLFRVGTSVVDRKDGGVFVVFGVVPRSLKIKKN